MAQRRVTVAAPEGLHARPAALFVQAAAKAPVPVTIGREGGSAVSARSILAVLSLDVRNGEEVLLDASGDGAEECLDALAQLLATEPAPAQDTAGG